MHRGWGKCKLPSGKANKDSKSKPILTQNANFTLLFAILHEIPIAPKRPLSRWEMLSPNDFLGQNWIFEARKGCVFFEKSCPKLTILLQNDPFSHLTPGSWCTQGKRSTHYKWRTRFEWRTRKPASSHKPTPASHPLAPWSPLRGRPPFPSSLFLGYLNLGQCTGQPFERSVWLTDHTLLHSLLGAMVNWKNCTT